MLPTHRTRTHRPSLFVPARARSATLAITLGMLIAGTAACSSSGSTTGPSTPPVTSSAPLRELAKTAGIDVGFAIDPARLSEPEYKAIADSEFNLVVPENVMKWETTEPAPGSFDFGPGDEVVKYARSTDKVVYGHNLVWHSQLPSWVSDLDAADMSAAMENHITTQAAHFAGQVVAWDVVNEAFDDDGSRRAESPFQQKLGDGYVEDAFRTAHAADPHAKLCYNDYNLESIGRKSDAVYAMVKDFKARGVPIDCVGFQGHLIVGQVPSDLVPNLERFLALGVDVRITELDIRMETPASESDLQQQAADYATVFADCLAVTGCQGVTTWGITDKYSWVPQTFSGQGAALIWDEDYARKPAYDAVAQALRASAAS